MRWLALLLLLPASASADVLFVDVNNSPSEIKAAREELARRNPPENLIVLSRKPYTTEESAELARLQADKKKLSAELKQLRKKKRSELTPDDQAKIKAVQDQQQADDTRLAELRDDHDVNGYNLAKLLDQSKGSKISSIIVSGHSLGHTFMGDNGQINVDEIRHAFSDRGLTDAVRSVYLMGCYSGTKMSRMAWKEGFANAGFIAGFDGKAPLAKGASPKFLSALMAREKEIAAASDSAAMTKATHDVSKLLNSRHLVVQTDKLVCKYGGVKPMSEQEECNQDLEFLSNQSGCGFDVYLRADRTLCKSKVDVDHDIAVDTPENPSPIRLYYNRLQSFQGCTRLCPSLKAKTAEEKEKLESQQPGWCDLVDFSFPHIDETIALIKYNHVKVNFGKKFRSEIDELDGLLDLPENATPACSRFKDKGGAAGLATEPRTQAVKAIKELGDCVSELSKKKAPDAHAFLDMDLKVEKLLSELDCVPPSWIDDSGPNGEGLKDPTDPGVCGPTAFTDPTVKATYLW